MVEVPATSSKLHFGIVRECARAIYAPHPLTPPIHIGHIAIYWFGRALRITVCMYGCTYYMYKHTTRGPSLALAHRLCAPLFCTSASFLSLSVRLCTPLVLVPPLPICFPCAFGRDGDCGLQGRDIMTTTGDFHACRHAFLAGFVFWGLVLMVVVSWFGNLAVGGIGVAEYCCGFG